MRRARTVTAALAAVGFMLAPGVVAASDASTLSYNCREVTAYDITFFKYSTGSAEYPFKLYRGERFKSWGVYDGRYKAQTHDDYWGYTTTNSAWVKHVPDYYCGF